MRLIFIFCSVILLQSTISAQLSPGDLSRPHADLEGLSNCQKCHALEQQISAEKCLDCHTILADRIRSKKGLHAGSTFQKCQSCHAEHNGRDFELIWWPDGQDQFDHAQTGYSLEGKHRDLTCRKCHQQKNIADSDELKKSKIDPDRTYLGLRTNCIACHTDPHSRQFKQSCESCHSMMQWKPVQTFDHQKTAFPLTGGHINVTCNKCHPSGQDQKMIFRPVKHEQCADCHKDPHQNRFGDRCTDCHNTAAWRGQAKKGFDHNQTSYPLRGRHQNVTCKSCHPPGKALRGIQFNKCSNCHRDYHRGAFQDHVSRGACESCHTVDGFIPTTFGIPDHQKSDYPLEGAHLAVPCIACHRSGQGPPRFSFTNRDCQVCHINLHGEEAGPASKYDQGKGCAFCHSEESWNAINFDHSHLPLPLEGKHAVIRCSLCHKKSDNGMLRFSGLTSTCQNCHNDAHYRQFEKDGGVDCGRCHIPKDWIADKFDHNRDSRFLIDGQHQYVKCARCHPKTEQNGVKFTLYKPLETACAACHKNQNPGKE